MRINNLDGLRGFAALFVLVGHVSNQTAAAPWLYGPGSAQVGVQIFFALSGFLMGKLYLPTQPSLGAIGDYLRRRAARVLPLYVLLVIASYFAFRWAGWPVLYAIDDTNLAKHLLLQSATSVLWTIPVEVSFYIAFPILWLAFAWSARLGRTLLAVALVACLLVPLPFIDRPYLIAFFLVGVAASLVRPPPKSSVLSAMTIGLAVIMLEPIWVRLGYPALDIWRSPLHLLVAGALVLGAQRAPLANLLFGNGFARYLGKISYSMYLLHWPIMANITIRTDIEQNPVLYLLCTIVATMGAATLTHYLIEVPARRLIGGPRGKSTKTPPLVIDATRSAGVAASGAQAI